MSRVTDPTRLDVFRNTFEAVADTMGLTLVRTCRSTVVRTAMDFSTGVLTPRGDLVGQGLCKPNHLGVMMQALAPFLHRYGEETYPGDIFVTNDPYEGAATCPTSSCLNPSSLRTSWWPICAQ